MQYILNNHIIKILVILDFVFWGFYSINNQCLIFCINLTFLYFVIKFNNDYRKLIFSRIVYGNLFFLILSVTTRQNLNISQTPLQIDSFYLIVIMSATINIYIVQSTKLNVTLIFFTMIYTILSYKHPLSIYSMVTAGVIVIIQLMIYYIIKNPISYNKIINDKIQNIHCTYMNAFSNINKQSVHNLIEACTILGIKVNDNMDALILPEHFILLSYIKQKTSLIYAKDAKIYIKPNSDLLLDIQGLKNITIETTNNCIIISLIYQTLNA